MRLILSLLLCFLVGCATVPPPIDEYTIARAALDAARAVDAAKYAPAFWSQAESLYIKAQSLYRENEFKQAKELFVSAKNAAEKAENTARLQRVKNGEVF